MVVRSQDAPKRSFVSLSENTTEGGFVDFGEQISDWGVLIQTEQDCLRLAYDKKLGRKVWIYQGASLAPAAAHCSPSGLRVIKSSAFAGHGTVYECPGGAPLVEYERKDEGMPWELARLALLDIVRHLKAFPGDDCLGRLWIDQNGRLRVLPFWVSRGVGAESEMQVAGLAAGGDVERVVAPVLRSLVFKRGASEVSRKEMLPVHAERLVNLVCNSNGDTDLEVVEQELERRKDCPANIGYAARLKVGVLVVVIPIILACATMVVWREAELGGWLEFAKGNAPQAIEAGIGPKASGGRISLPLGLQVLIWVGAKADVSAAKAIYQEYNAQKVASPMEEWVPEVMLRSGKKRLSYTEDVSDAVLCRIAFEAQQLQGDTWTQFDDGLLEVLARARLRHPRVSQAECEAVSYTHLTLPTKA